MSVKSTKETNNFGTSKVARHISRGAPKIRRESFLHLCMWNTVKLKTRLLHASNEDHGIIYYAIGKSMYYN